MKKMIFIIILIVLVGLFAGTSVFAQTTLDQRGYLWEGESFTQLLPIGPYPRLFHVMEAIREALGESGYTVLYDPSWGDVESLTVADRDNHYSGSLILMGTSWDFKIDLIATPSKPGLVKGVIQFGDAVAGIIISAIEEFPY